MSLKEYKAKRRFNKTPEPAGAPKSSTVGNLFVVQKHAASRLHYDFRLELDGTLKSWAVPKGPSLDPGVKALAVQVEDHPLDYADFEGVIPAGEYGGGTVMVWDQGTWEPDGDAARDFKQGKLKFQLRGTKLKGGWSLVRMKGRANDDGKNWLLIKMQDKQARPDAKTDFLARNARSVLTKRTMEEIASQADRVWSSRGSQSNGKSQSKKPANGKVTKRGAGAVKALTATTKKAPKEGATRTNGKAARLTAAALSKLASAAASARRTSFPKSFRPQLATLSTDIPAGDNWLHEIKFDGYRLLAIFNKGKARLVTRQGNDWTHRFSSIASAIEELPLSEGIFDGEVVYLGEGGISDFQQLQNTLKLGTEKSLVFYLFDLPRCGEWDLTSTPLEERKELLAKIILAKSPNNDGVLRYSDHIRGQGGEVWQHACRGAMEGIISKRADAPYLQSRSTTWLKIKCLKRQEFVIGGFTKPSGARTGFGALLLGVYDGEALTYTGRVGTGFTEQSLKQLKTELKSRATSEPPFELPPTGAQARGVTWVVPELVCEVAFTEWTDEGLLRHPSFQGLREDKAPKDVKREVAKKVASSNKTGASKNGKAMKTSQTAPQKRTTRTTRSTKSGADSTVAGVTISNPDRVLYEEQGVTKLDLAKYYERVADWILPHLVDRPLTLVRCPSGAGGSCFYQKHLTESTPERVRGVKIKEKDSTDEYLVIDDLEGLISLVQIGVLEFHPWPAKADAVEKPDRLVFDLDPGEGVEWPAVVEGAKRIREVLEEVGLESFLRTSGGKGLHVVVPLTRRNTWDEVKGFSKGLADRLARDEPDRYIATMSKAKRRGKVYVDYLRNQRGATAVASYSTRARKGAPVATPVSWDELTTRLKPDAFNVKNIFKRLDSLKADPWHNFFDVRQSLTKKMLREMAS